MVLYLVRKKRITRIFALHGWYISARLEECSIAILLLLLLDP